MEFFSKHLLYSMVDKISASNDWDVVFKLKTFVQVSVDKIFRNNLFRLMQLWMLKLN